MTERMPDQYINRFFGLVKRSAGDGAIIVERLDGRGEVYVRPHDAAGAGVELQSGDKVELSIVRGRGFHLVLATMSGTRHMV